MKDKFAIDILLLDDDPFVLDLLRHILARLGYLQVHGYENGSSALQAFDGVDGEPELILLDINMPCMDGLEFVRHLAARHYSGSLILVSGEDDLMLRATEQLARAFNLSVLGSLHKPPAPEILSTLIQKWNPRLDEKRRAPRKTYAPDAIRAAISNSEFTNYYQPQVAVATGAFIGVEALVRWQHPQDGLVFPDQFISVAEEHGLISDLTHTVIKQALLQSKVWRDSGLPLQTSVNVSMEDLSQLGFAGFVVDAILAAGLPPQSLVLEVTESRLMQKLTTVLEVLSRLRLKRLRLSIDDFGTGHSSLLQLCSLPLDELKIDRSFTHNAWQDPRLKAIFEASLNLGKQIGMEIVAEGVEDIDDWGFLCATGCPVAQGYFISRPMPAAAIPEWQAEWQSRFRHERLAEG